MSARQGALITNSIRQMKNEEFTSHELTLDLLDQFIGLGVSILSIFAFYLLKYW